MDVLIQQHAKILWGYLCLGQPCVPMDAIFALGSDATRVAVRAAQLWHEGYGSHVIVSGVSEGYRYASIVREHGVPEHRIIVEPLATNTGENIEFTKKLLAEHGYTFRSFVLVQKPYMERRVYATFRKVWPEARCCVTSPQIPFEQYVRDEAAREQLVHYLVGTLYRIQTYPALGFQTEQVLPEDVLQSYQWLCAHGYTNTLPTEQR